MKFIIGQTYLDYQSAYRFVRSGKVQVHNIMLQILEINAWAIYVMFWNLKEKVWKDNNKLNYILHNSNIVRVHVVYIRFFS